MTEHTPYVRHPYPGVGDDPWFDGFEDLVRSLDVVDFAAREDRHLVFSGGGTVSWDAVTGLFSWTEEIQILAAITGRQWTIPAGSASLPNTGSIWYASIPRAPTMNMQVATVVANTVPGLAGGNEALALVVRVGTLVYLRTGVSIASGNSITGFAPQLPGPVIVPPDLRTAAIIVGNSPAGDTALDCDYLDVGDGVQLEAALAAAGIGGTRDVYIRPGTYDMNAGAVVARMVIPAGVRVRGAGRFSTFVSTRTAGDCRAFVLAPGAVLEDVGVVAPVPTALQVGDDGIITLGGDGAEAKRCRVEFTGGWVGIGDPGWIAVEAGLCTALGVVGEVRNTDCEVIDTPHALALGAMGPMQAVLTEAGVTLMNRCVLEGGDWSVVGLGRILANGCISRDSDLGVLFLTPLSRYDGGEVYIDSPIGIESAVTLVGFGHSVCDNYLEATTGAGGSIAVFLSAATECVIHDNRGNGNVAPPVGWPVAVHLDAASNGNSVMGNVFGGGAVVVDLGAGNDVAHNI
jgi:hypothetical protein